MHRDAASKVQGDREAALNRLIEACPLIKEYLAGARRVTSGPYGELRVRKDYSYCNTRFWRPGMVLVGDAACFVDPVFSSGVHLATYSGLLAARSVNSCLAARSGRRRRSRSSNAATGASTASSTSSSSPSTGCRRTSGPISGRPRR